MAGLRATGCFIVLLVAVLGILHRDACVAAFAPDRSGTHKEEIDDR